jgi:hypothetical protein
VLGSSIFLRSWFTNNLRRPQTAWNNSWGVRALLRCVTKTRVAVGECVETMWFQHAAVRIGDKLKIRDLNALGTSRVFGAATDEGKAH